MVYATVDTFNFVVLPLVRILYVSSYYYSDLNNFLTDKLTKRTSVKAK